MKIVNLTPHPITLRNSIGGEVTYQSSGVARLIAAMPKTVNRIDDIPVISKDTFTGVDGLPAPKDGVVYIVSGLVASHVNRADVFSPATGPNDGAIRNDKGHIIAVTKLKSSI